MSLRPLAAATSLILILAACGDDPGVADVVADVVADADAVADVTTPDVVPDVVPELVPDTAPAANQLVFTASGCATTCQATADSGTAVDITVMYRKPTGEPIPNATVRFAIDVTADVARLTSFTSTTTANGQATVSLSLLANTATPVKVDASVDGDAGAGVISYTVTIAPVIPAPLELTFAYTGTSPAASYALRLFKQTGGKPTCAELDPDQPGGIPTADLALGPYPLTDKAKIAVLPDLDTELTQTWAVRAIGPPTGTTLVSGCVQGVEVKYGETKAVTLNLVDLPLRWEGEYRLTTTADMHTGIPGAAGDIVSFLIGLFTKPGEVALLAACKNPSGLLDTICDFLKSGDQLSATGLIAADAANVAFFELAAKVIGDDVVVTGQSIASLLSDLRLGSKLTLASEPTVADLTDPTVTWFPADTVGEVWETASFYWKFGLDCAPSDLECGLIGVKLIDIYKKVLTAKFGASVDAAGAIWIEPHTVPGFDYGTLLNFIIERKVLPLLFGDGTVPHPDEPGEFLPPVDSYEKVIGTIFGDELCLYYDDCCEWFSQKEAVVENVPLDAETVISACELLIPAGADWIRDQVATLSGSLEIGSPEGERCMGTSLFGKRNADALGSKEAQCKWEATFDLGGTPFSPAATWWGSRI
ncbi:MAG: hypothetical protein H6746_20590 [Deltaproteobacteria bacterium]|nr:hypothetical protein [Deltaproteobacteria bacterium]